MNVSNLQGMSNTANQSQIKLNSNDETDRIPIKKGLLNKELEMAKQNIKEHEKEASKYIIYLIYS